jgi:hypothetical protein
VIEFQANRQRKSIDQQRFYWNHEGAMKALIPLLFILVLTSTTFPQTSPHLQREHSKLWGIKGELWDPAGRLPDFSYAGYGRGERDIPHLTAGISVRDFGAKGDGQTDDTRAFQTALKEVVSGAIEIPRGRYVITDFLEIRRSGVVLRGVGPEESILYFPKPLNAIKPNWGATTTGRRTSNYSWSGGQVIIRGAIGSRVLTSITKPATRGSRKITVAAGTSLKVGQEIEVFQRDLPDNSLAIHLYSDDGGPVNKLKGRAKTSLITRIVSIKGNEVTLERTLRCDLRLPWSPQVRSFEPSVTESGIEDIGFEFPVKPYQGHFTELGFNPVALSNVAHCWVRNIRIAHADSGPFVHGFFNTIDGVVFESNRREDNQQCTGHHGISLGGGDNLVSRFDFRTRFIHDITVSGFTSGNVIAKGRGIDLSLDHHRKAPYANLFTDIHAGEGSRLWKCGGGAALGKHCGAYGTFWNVRSDHPLSYPRDRFGPPTMNLVALETEQTTIADEDGKWFEAIHPAKVEPQNLYRAQLKRRLDP